MEVTPIVRPENPLEATRWDDAISSLWFYLLGPGYSAKNNDSCALPNSDCMTDELSIDKCPPIAQVSVSKDPAC